MHKYTPTHPPTHPHTHTHTHTHTHKHIYIYVYIFIFIYIYIIYIYIYIYNKNSIHERGLRITYQGHISTFQELLNKGNSFSIHHRNL